jgi:hypothetical protein
MINPLLKAAAGSMVPSIHPSSRRFLYSGALVNPDDLLASLFL